jgi:lysine 6-dehydrogenase
MAFDFIVFGGTGQQGRLCVRDLLESGYRVMIAGRNETAVSDLLKNRKTGFIFVDLKDQNSIADAITKSGAKVVVNCAELTFNVEIMKACLKTKRSCTDLGGLQYVTLQQFRLNQEFKKAGILNITGCGSTPGISNVMTAHAIEKFDSIETIDLGFAWDANIKKFIVPYSMHSIFDEFTQNPVIFMDGKFRKASRMICKGTFNFKEIGKQTTYCIVHSEVYTFARYFKKFGLKNVHYMAGFPEHSIKVIQTLMDLDFNSENEINMNGTEIKPVDFSDKVLTKLEQPKGYKEVEDLWVKISGMKDGKKKESQVDCIVKTTKGWEDAGSNVDTGRTISVISQMLLRGEIEKTGVHGPEACVPHKPFFAELAKRKMFIYQDGKKIN